MSGIPILLIAVLGLFIFFKVASSVGSKNYGREKEQFLDDEYEGNNVRIKDFNESFTYIPNIDKLPIKNYNDKESKIYKAQDLVIRSSKNKMIVFDENYTNLELKHIFGFNHLDNVFMYEDNFNRFIINLNDWARLSIEENSLIDAETILNYILEIGSNHTQTYKLLIEVYKKSNRENKFSAIVNTVNEEEGISDYEKNIILKYVSEINNLEKEISS